MQYAYDLPAGTKVRFVYDALSGNCVKTWGGWDETGTQDYGGKQKCLSRSSRHRWRRAHMGAPMQYPERIPFDRVDSHGSNAIESLSGLSPYSTMSVCRGSPWLASTACAQGHRRRSTYTGG